jgi:hypothetical protein
MERKKMRRKNKRDICISIALSLILLLSFLVVLESASAQGFSIPIKLALTAESSNIEVGETTFITLTLEDENDEPITTEVDVAVNISTNLGSAPSSIIIASGTNSTSAKFSSSEPGIAVISAKSKGLLSDSISIAIMSPIPTPTPVETPYVKLNMIESKVLLGQPLVVTGTTNKKEGLSIVITVKGPKELSPKTVLVENGKFTATFDTTTAMEGTYAVKADDGDGHTDETTVRIGAGAPPTPTPKQPGFEAVFAISGALAAALLMLERRRDA